MTAVRPARGPSGARAGRVTLSSGDVSAAQSPSRARSTPAPPPPGGWLVGPPDYVGVGAAHAGTAWWDRLILAHPAVERAPGIPPGIDHFRDRWRDGLDEAGVSAYHAWFPRPTGCLVGEWTPGYMLDAWVAPLLRRSAPDARLLALLRDPVARFGAGQREDEGRERLGVTPRAAANASFSRGLYADQVLRLWSSYPRDRVLVLQVERCLREPRSQLRRTYAFLGLDPDVADEVDVRLPFDPPQASPRLELATQQAAALARAYAPENARLAELLPDLDLGLWTRPGTPARSPR